MSLTLYYHPLASFCQKVLVALYENGTRFEPHLVDLGDPVARDAFLTIWPIGKFPVLRDDARAMLVPESTIVIEYLETHYPGKSALLPADKDLALQTRLEDRFYDMYVEEPVQKIVLDKLRPEGQGDPFGVDKARSVLETAYAQIENKMATRMWATGDTFSMADCSAAPALFYANLVQPFGAERPHTSAYLARLMERPSFARVVDEAKPFFPMFPG